MTREDVIELMKTIKKGNYLGGIIDIPSDESTAFDMAIKALEQEPCEDVMTIHTQGLDEGIRCAMCTNSMKSDRGCDGGCVVNEAMYKEVMNTIRNHIVPSVTPTPKWIPCSERLPKEFEFVNCTCHSLIDDREDWVVETVYIPQPPDSPYSDWGNIPMLNMGDCEVVAWVHRDIPKPYKAEMESEE